MYSPDLSLLFSISMSRLPFIAILSLLGAVISTVSPQIEDPPADELRNGQVRLNSQNSRL